jgi:hypothetical protein
MVHMGWWFINLATFKSSTDYLKTINYATDYTNTELVKGHTRGSSNSGTAIDSYKLIEFNNIDAGEHRISIIYRKDNSSSSGYDCGYVIIPKEQE